MKKTLKIAVLAVIAVTPALADTPYVAGSLSNLENPLYLPTHGELYSRVGFGTCLSFIGWNRLLISALFISSNSNIMSFFPLMKWGPTNKFISLIGFGPLVLDHRP